MTSPFTWVSALAWGRSFTSGLSSISVQKRSRSIDVMPFWNCSVNSTIRRMDASNVETNNKKAIRPRIVARVIAPSRKNSAPAMTTTMYISPSTMRRDMEKPASSL